MEEIIEREFKLVEQGQKLFEKLFQSFSLNARDSFLLVLTDCEECIYLGIKYLSAFIQRYKKRNVYVLLDNNKYENDFIDAGGNVVFCKELRNLAAYLNVFRKKNTSETQILFLTEKDGYGIEVEKLIKNNEFTLEEYIAIALYQLNNLSGGLEIEKR